VGGTLARGICQHLRIRVFPSMSRGKARIFRTCAHACIPQKQMLTRPHSTQVAAMIVHNAIMDNSERTRDFAEKEALGSVLGGMLRRAYSDHTGPLCEKTRQVGHGSKNGSKNMRGYMYVCDLLTS
jgi:hypothetical protein